MLHCNRFASDYCFNCSVNFSCFLLLQPHMQIHQCFSSSMKPTSDFYTEPSEARISLPYTECHSNGKGAFAFIRFSFVNT